LTTARKLGTQLLPAARLNSNRIHTPLARVLKFSPGISKWAELFEGLCPLFWGQVGKPKAQRGAEADCRLNSKMAFLQQGISLKELAVGPGWGGVQGATDVSIVVYTFE
jgi:hypothetical protein